MEKGMREKISIIYPQHFIDFIHYRYHNKSIYKILNIDLYQENSIKIVVDKVNWNRHNREKIIIGYWLCIELLDKRNDMIVSYNASGKFLDTPEDVIVNYWNEKHGEEYLNIIAKEQDSVILKDNNKINDNNTVGKLGDEVINLELSIYKFNFPKERVYRVIKPIPVILIDEQHIYISLDAELIDQKEEYFEEIFKQKSLKKVLSIRNSFDKISEIYEIEYKKDKKEKYKNISLVFVLIIFLILMKFIKYS